MSVCGSKCEVCACSFVLLCILSSVVMTLVLIRCSMREGGRRCMRVEEEGSACGCVEEGEGEGRGERGCILNDTLKH